MASVGGRDGGVDVSDGGAVESGLLQTQDYAEAVMRAIDPDVPNKQISQWLEFRMKRQKVLDRQDYTAILDEAVLHRPFGGPNVIRDQLARLLTISERPNITLRVLPFSAGALASPESVFTLLTPFPVVAQLTADPGTIYVEMPKLPGSRPRTLAWKTTLWTSKTPAGSSRPGWSNSHDTLDRPWGQPCRPLPRALAHQQLQQRRAGGTCVEAGPLNDGTGRIALRHSKNPDGPVIVYTRAEWDAFLDGTKDGEFGFRA